MTAGFIQFHKTHRFSGRIIEMVTSLEALCIRVTTHPQVFGTNLHLFYTYPQVFGPRLLTHSGHTSSVWPNMAVPPGVLHLHYLFWILESPIIHQELAVILRAYLRFVYKQPSTLKSVRISPLSTGRNPEASALKNTIAVSLQLYR